VPPGQRFAELRVEEAVESGAEVLATACPYCVNMLTDACKGLGFEGRLNVVELSELLAGALG
jgi:Fe-S oxidoreductase